MDETPEQSSLQQPPEVPTRQLSAAARPRLSHIALGVILVGIGVAAILVIAMRGEGTMFQREAVSKTRSEVPPIDKNAPTETKTATFAMG